MSSCVISSFLITPVFVITYHIFVLFCFVVSPSHCHPDSHISNGPSPAGSVSSFQEAMSPEHAIPLPPTTVSPAMSSSSVNSESRNRTVSLPAYPSSQSKGIIVTQPTEVILEEPEPEEVRKPAGVWARFRSASLRPQTHAGNQSPAGGSTGSGRASFSRGCDHHQRNTPSPLSPLQKKSVERTLARMGNWYVFWGFCLYFYSFFIISQESICYVRLTLAQTGTPVLAPQVNDICIMVNVC